MGILLNKKHQKYSHQSSQVVNIIISQQLQDHQSLQFFDAFIPIIDVAIQEYSLKSQQLSSQDNKDFLFLAKVLKYIIKPFDDKEISAFVKQIEIKQKQKHISHISKQYKLIAAGRDCNDLFLLYKSNIYVLYQRKVTQDLYFGYKLQEDAQDIKFLKNCVFLRENVMISNHSIQNSSTITKKNENSCLGYLLQYNAQLIRLDFQKVIYAYLLNNINTICTNRQLFILIDIFHFKILKCKQTYIDDKISKFWSIIEFHSQIQLIALQLQLFMIVSNLQWKTRDFVFQTLQYGQVI
ncbi:Hypothetical_protein [Hexamita inflata]|uniref:Hypothetical_protein n=1 Tax=Hexamita inflata TaxID=28002 RepID=A0ABP1GX16_9EUKA